MSVSRQMREIRSWIFWLFDVLIAAAIFLVELGMLPELFQQSIMTFIGNNIGKILAVAVLAIISSRMEKYYIKNISDEDGANNKTMRSGFNIILGIVGVWIAIVVLKFWNAHNIEINGWGTYCFFFYPAFAWYPFYQAIESFRNYMYPVREEPEEE